MTITLPLWLIWTLGCFVLVIIIAVIAGWVCFARAWGNGRISW